LLRGGTPCAQRAVTPTYRGTIAAEARLLARKPNYDFEKRRKELDRKAKKDAKREDRARRRAAGLPDEPDETVEQADGSETPTAD
jgi:hypothetical protein